MNQMDYLIMINRQQLQSNEANRLERQLAKPESETQGVYQGFDDISQLHKVKLSNGDMLYGRFNTTGAVGIGDRVDVFRPASGIPLFDAMPR